VNADRFLRATATALALAVAGLAVGCTPSGQSGDAFAVINIDRFGSGTASVGNVNSNLGDRQATTSVCVTLSNTPKNPTVSTPTALDNVTIVQYTVSYQRLDGGPPPGPFVFNTAFTVPAGRAASSTDPTVTGNSASVLVVLVPAQAKNEPPLLPRPATPLNAVANIVFKGHDGRGQTVSAQGSLSVTFTFDQETTEAPLTC
jgi:hypothetical protein